MVSFIKSRTNSAQIPVSADDPLPVYVAGASGGTTAVKELRAATGTESNVAGNAGSVTILVANADRLMARVYNDSSAILYLLLGTGTASTTVFTAKLFPEDYFEDTEYRGIISGIWASATGAARVTEYT